MLVWLDILTPKQLLLLNEIGKHLEKKGYQVLYTTRQYREVDDLVKLQGVKAVVVGEYGGGSLEGKLAASAHRIEELSHIIGSAKPALSLAFASPDAARVAFGLGIPHYTLNDSPHSIPVARLTIPLAEKLFAPAVIPKKTWIGLGAKREQIIQYNGLDPVAWLRHHKPNPAILNELGLDSSRPIVVFRAEEAFAAYLIGKVTAQSVTVPIMNDLIRSHANEAQIVVLARYPEQVSAIRSALPKEAIVPSKAVDGASLLSFTSLFVGAGGTMTAEAALLGVPAISCYPGEPTIVEKYLVRERLIQRICEPKRAAKRVRQILGDLSKELTCQRERARLLMNSMEDPVDIVVRQVEDAFPPVFR
jgi:predicted glycosyltransferase